MKVLYTAAFFLFAFVQLSYQSSDRKCRALALSGGGSKGAYQAGVLMALSNIVPDPQVNLAYDVVTGVSAGSLNALGIGGFAPEDINGAAEFIYALWNSIPDNNAYGNWPGGIVEGLFSKSGIFDLSPGVKWVSDRWQSRTVNRKVSFATVDANEAAYTVYDFNATGTLPPDYIESAFASSSIPAIFPYILRGDKTLIDGGVIWNLDVPSAIRRCKEIVDDEKDIIVDFILCGDHSIATVEELAKKSTIGHLMRGMEVKSFFNGMNDYNSSVQAYPDVTFRYVIAPSENIEGGFIPLDFSRTQVDSCFRIGKKDAENAVKLGSGGYGQTLLEYTERFKKGEEVNLDQMINEKVSQMSQFRQESS